MDTASFSPKAGLKNDRQLKQGKKPIICLEDVVKVYKSEARSFTALKNVNLKIFPGEFVAIIGTSGAGKTTLVNMITGTDRLSSGKVWVSGINVHDQDESNLALWRGLNLGVIYQSFHLLPNLSLVDNVMLPMDLCRIYRPFKSRQRAIDLLDQVGLAEHARKLPAQISGGQQQRVAIARALANDPTLIIADEPTGRLDSRTAETIFDIFLSLVQQGKTILMVTHDQSMVNRVPRTITIRDGEVFEI